MIGAASSKLYIKRVSLGLNLKDQKFHPIIFHERLK